VLIHLNLHRSSLWSRQSPASNFLAARIGAFEALLCYAKITPAALRRGDCKDRCAEGVEAVGRGLEFQSGDFSRNITGAPLLAVKLPRWHQVEQDVPGA
jgi:hypothetical protein